MSRHQSNDKSMFSADNLLSSFKVMISDLTGTNNISNNSVDDHHLVNSRSGIGSDPSKSMMMKKQLINSTLSNHKKEKRTIESTSRGLFPQSIDCLENKLDSEVEKVRQVLDHPNASAHQLESGDRALDDLICLISSQLSEVSELKSSNHKKLVDTMKSQSISTNTISKKPIKEKEELLNLSATQTIQPLTNNEQSIWDELFNTDIASDNPIGSEYDPRCDKQSESIFCGLPSDLLIHIGTFLFAKDLLNVGQCNVRLLKLFFNQTPYRTISLYKMKPLVDFDHLKKGTNRLIMDDQIEEYKKDEGESYSQVQQFIWKPLVCFFFPRLNKSLNITNWMHTLRRRIAHVRLYEPNKLPLSIYQNSEMQQSMSSLPVFNSVPVPFIENCEWIYKCPMNFNDLPETQPNVRYCDVCSRSVYIAKTKKEFVELAHEGKCVGLQSQEISLPWVPYTISGGMPVITTLPNYPSYNYPNF